MINVAFYVPKLIGGGAERVFVNLANELSEMSEYKVFMFVSRLGGVYEAELKEKVELISLGDKTLFKSIMPLQSKLKLYSISHLICGMPFPNLLGIFQKFFINKLHVTVVEHNDLRVQLLEKTGGWRKKLSPKIIKYSYGFADEVICVSKGVQEFVNICNRKISHKVTTIYNPIFSFELIKKSNHPIDDCDFKKGKLTLITVARLNRQKNLSLFIATCCELKKLMPDFRAYILGEGEEGALLQRKILDNNLQDSVKLMGFKKNPYNYIKCSDVFLLTSKWEGFGNVLVESAACGTPVVSINCPSGPKEIIENLNFGILVEQSKPELLAKAVLECFYTDFESCAGKMAEYSIENIAKKYTKVIFKNI
ncbi:hypothetical protein CWC11_17475 [Pseudoalteromonas sp. S3178]|uniref:glycosyltransferase n=1 Tax=Pseudoalteromonas sp. S3178 TaxID=579532 RepID=UPI00110B034E|nr:glycosyltransferase [Pseudoalteromonas sp. S3178]TMP02598.1 hypothetical protein CWC11_17475 [Pseudoalteromonas sp. S3178]